MTKKKRKHNPNLVRARHSYTSSEIAEIYNLHIRTVRDWKKQGLQLLDETSKPYLVLGEEVKRFLREKTLKRKHPLKPGEFFCPKCHNPRKSIPDQVSVKITDRKLGKKYRQAIVKGICEACGCSLNLFSSDKKIQELIKKMVFLTEHETTLIGSGDSSANAHTKKDENVKS